ncbi:MAG: HemK family protein methyltransferase [Candidatus Gracilibacteria bacterium]|nr:HemK family protein methyltransferase [Candidatus Gracilibacteria bacterium]
MNKKEIYNIGKNKYKINEDIITKILLNKLKITKKELFFLEKIIPFDDIIKSFNDYNNGQPIEYIINSSEFYGLNFYVDNRVLIPRNDTEIMVDIILDTLSTKNNFSYIDVGTGSSCIPISILINTNKIKNTYVLDISKNALDVSKINIEKYNLSGKIIQTQSDLLSNINYLKYKFEKNLIISANLPYIKDNDFENMDKEVILYEPKIALYGGEETGFELYEKLISQIQNLKIDKNIDNVIAFFEIGFYQYLYSKNYLTQKGLKFEYFKDMNNINRVIKINL